ncbi:hypothetical protein BCR42DRAFT_393274 [Absidia repens]|uniref:Secreted protein n=1 Tax=Absidia repens TaxID=90262 RepID=A0A1X2IGW4_9FUNG|nr:hypothetical protein BCR42DRAFT_393274 [Absidia repens]
MMRMLGLVLLGSFLWMSSSSVVHAEIFDPMNLVGDPGIVLYVCNADKGQCNYTFYVKLNGTKTRYKIPRTDCNSAQSNGYTFTRALDNKSFHALSHCSGMSIDTLEMEYQLSFRTCMAFTGSTCQNSETSTTTTT